MICPFAKFHCASWNLNKYYLPGNQYVVSPQLFVFVKSIPSSISYFLNEVLDFAHLYVSGDADYITNNLNQNIKF